jgi:hypothetical protein
MPSVAKLLLNYVGTGTEGDVKEPVHCVQGLDFLGT